MSTNKFDKPRRSSLSSRDIQERIKLQLGEAVQARFQAWLADQTHPLPMCEQHTRQALIFDPAASNYRPAYYESTPENLYRDLHFEPGAFEFTAYFRCPACAAADAFCPPEFHATGFDGFATDTQERANGLSVCRTFVAQVNAHGCGTLLMVGGTGTGKTRLATGAVRELHGHRALYVRQGELTLALRATYGRKDVVLHRSGHLDDDDPPPTALEVVQQVRLLILDELGCLPLANDERLLLDELIKHRYDERKPTIYLSNLPLDELKKFLGDAAFERVKYATGNGKFLLQFDGASYRRNAGEDYLTPLAPAPENPPHAAAMAELSRTAKEQHELWRTDRPGADS